ncbi:efflux transporter periplasmic adaptor subunit [Vibrio ponticus]|uniref:Efflux transporter periplasmic adaptor subunit n=1 Tax=Vibrio ponticus TaxID=265668 RepID=A0ABX3FKY4_9VIBR|nr:efflux RND transporter periplasmic adaptor subunit [Vibrio ponticus]OLQ93734.1 efflux transporter periplasmic adaptor subunit [Vibrio ponticus]
MNKTIIALASLLTVTTAQATDLIGHVQGLNRHSVVAQVSGVVEIANLEVGDQVQQDQVLAQIKSNDFQFSVDKAKANVALAEADLTLRKATYQRYQALSQKNSLSVGELDSARAAFLSAKASVDVAKIEYQQCLQDLADTQVQAKLSGYITNKPTQIGAWVNEGELLYEITNIDKVTLSFMASEYDLDEFSVQQPVVVWSESNPSLKIEAQVQRIGVEMHTQSQTYPILVEIENHGALFKPGMSVYVSTDTSLLNLDKLKMSEAK